MAKSAVKRVRISKMQQHITLSVLAVSLVFGTSIVFAVFFIKWISFNSLVINAKETSIRNYDTAIANIGVCKDSDGDGKFTDKELDDCNPDALDVAEDLKGTLRYNVMVDLANNMDLESVARDSLIECYDDGKKINFTERYRKSGTDEERAENLMMLKKCSALRVIPDALPSSLNEEALLASLNKIFLLSNWEPESLAPGSVVGENKMPDIESVPVDLSVSANILTTTSVLAGIEKSIREFDINSALITWAGNDETGESMLELKAQANAFYVPKVTLVKEEETIYASKAGRDKAIKGGDKK